MAAVGPEARETKQKRDFARRRRRPATPVQRRTTRFFSQRYKRIAHRARASGPRQTRRSPAHHVARPHVTTRARTGRQPSRSTKARQQVKRRWYASHSHNVHIDPAVHGGRSCCCFAAPSSSTPDAKFQRSRSRSACLPSSCSAHLFHRTTGSPNQPTRTGPPKEKQILLFGAHCPAVLHPRSGESNQTGRRRLGHRGTGPTAAVPHINSNQIIERRL